MKEEELFLFSFGLTKELGLIELDDRRRIDVLKKRASVSALWK